MNKFKLLEAMDAAGYNQRSLAKAIGMSKNTLNNKLNGRGVFNIVEAEKICSQIKVENGAQKAEIFLS